MTDENKTLVIFTDNYPYSAVSENFLHQEIMILSNYFYRIMVVPIQRPYDIEYINRDLPNNVEVDNSLLIDTSNWFYLVKLSLNALKSSLLYKELFSKPKYAFNLMGFKKNIRYLGIAIHTKSWIEMNIQNKNFDLLKTTFYTYKLNPITLGIGLSKNNYPNIKLLSRAHGGDLYFERHKKFYIPYRHLTLKLVDKLFLISKKGKEYIQSYYPKYKNKYIISKLGVHDPKCITNQSNDNVFRIVSCSYLVSVKRIDLLIKGLKEVGDLKPNQSFEWTHIGYGPLKSELEKIADENLPENVNYSFLGFLENEDVHLYYKCNPVDVFINVSKSEGIPVSIMEAQSFGIPVIATNVGGVSEIVSNSVGILLNPNPTPKDIAKSISIFMDNPYFVSKVKINSKKNWDMNYNAFKNYNEFAQMIKKVN